MTDLNTSEERVSLLKTSISVKEIEQMWLEKNNIKTVSRILKVDDMA